MEFTNTEIWRMFFAAFFGGIIIGYLLTSWYNDELLDRAERKLAECEELLEELGAS